jgi:hypothetical protein
MANDSNNVSPLERYVALRTVRDNVFYQKPTAFNALDFIDDLPEPTRTLSRWYTDVLPSLGLISKKSEPRKAQITKAVNKTKESTRGGGATTSQALSNAARLGLAGTPVSGATSALVRLLEPKLPYHNGRFRSPTSLIANLNKVKLNRGYRKNLISDVIADAVKGGLASVIAGATTPILANRSKPSDKAIEEAGEIIHAAPQASALPSVDIVAALNGSHSSKLKNTALGGGIGSLMGAASPFVSPTLGLPLHILKGIIKKKLDLKAIAKDFSGAAKQLPLNTAVLGTTGAVGGFMLPHNTNE